MLVITKAMHKKSEENKSSKSKDEYAVKSAHAVVADKIKKRDPAKAPNIGDRVSYVVIRKERDARVYEKSEDPLWVLEHNLPIDFEYYLNQ